MSLSVLNLDAHNLLHYYETRDDGLYHVIRDFQDNSLRLSAIAKATGFQRDEALLYDLPTVSIKKEALTRADTEALAKLFPGITYFKMDDEWVTYDDRTIYVDKESYLQNNKSGTFLKNVSDAILRRAGIRRDTSEGDELSKKITEAFYRFEQGEISHDTWTIWREFYKFEVNYLTADDQHQPLWQAFFKRMNDQLALNFHTGSHRIYPLIDPSNEIVAFMRDRVAIHPLGRQVDGLSLFLNFNDESAVFYGLTSKIGSDQLAINDEAAPSKCIIERKREPLSGISEFINIASLSQDEKAKLALANEVVYPVTRNAFQGKKIKAILNDAIATFKGKPSQTVLNEKITQTLTAINQVIGFDELWAPTRLRKHKDIVVTRVSDEFFELDALIGDRRDRLSKVLNRNLTKKETVSNINGRKRAIQSHVLNCLDNLIGMRLIDEVYYRSTQLKSSELKGLFANIDKLDAIDSYGVKVTLPVEAAIIIKAVKDYKLAKDTDVTNELLEQQEVARASLQPVLTVQHDDNDELNGAENVVHSDVGEKIGGARIQRAMSGMP